MSFYRKRLVATILVFLVAPASFGAVNCELSQYTVEAYDHGGVYVHGSVGGHWVNFVAICGGSSWSQTEGMDCTGPATKNRLALAVAGQLASRNLELFFGNLNGCAEVKGYMRPQGVRLK